MTFHWTEDCTKQLVRMWGDGYSASVIANELGTTRNAVLGKIHRIGKGRGMKPKPRKKILPISSAYEPLSLKLALIETTTKTCKWPDGEGEHATFCGHRTEGTSPYCSFHRQVSSGGLIDAEADYMEAAE